MPITAHSLPAPRMLRTTYLPTCLECVVGRHLEGTLQPARKRKAPLQVAGHHQQCFCPGRAHVFVRHSPSVPWQAVIGKSCCSNMCSKKAHAQLCMSTVHRLVWIDPCALSSGRAFCLAKGLRSNPAPRITAALDAKAGVLCTPCGMARSTMSMSCYA